MSGPPSTRTIQIHAFCYKQDDDARNLPEHHERLRFGHVGISVDGVENIYGFTPVQPYGMDEDEFERRLIRGRECFDGQVRDDTAVFKIAQKYFTMPVENTIQVKYISVSSFLQVETRLERDMAKSPMVNKRYSFPAKERGKRFEPNCFNCATYLKTLADFLNIYPSGRLGDYMDRGTYSITIYECR